jgi:hypothetical protein
MKLDYADHHDKKEKEIEKKEPSLEILNSWRVSPNAPFTHFEFILYCLELGKIEQRPLKLLQRIIP